MSVGSDAPWHVAVDTGGTFTDALARAPDGSRHRAKVLSSSALRTRARATGRGPRLLIENPWRMEHDQLAGLFLRPLGDPGDGVEIRAFSPDAGALTLASPLPREVRKGDALELLSDEEAPLLAARLVTGRSRHEELPEVEMRLGTTLGTNALLTRRGAPTALFITAGFADLLEIGTQQRPDLFARRVVKAPSLLHRVVELPCRVSRRGERLRELDLAALEASARELVGQGIESAALALIHADRFPEDEARVAAALRNWGFGHVSSSAELSAEIRLLTRAQTAVVDATLAPLVDAYLGRIRATLGPRPLRVMTSAGGLVEGAAVRPKDMLLSGPAGGVVGASRAGARAGCGALLAFDMGGTSADVSRISGDFDYVFEHQVGDARLLAPALAIESVAAGGGSICTYDSRGLCVGPESAGAHPGPACYGAGGPLTLTDVNLLLGRLDPGLFGIPLRHEPAEAALDDVLARIRDDGQEIQRAALLEGFLDIANQRMADAIRRVSVQKGEDPAEHTLVAFGGAGGQHALAIAEALGISEVLIPVDTGLLSAAGLESARIERFAELQVLAPLDVAAGRLDALLGDLQDQALAALGEEGVPPTARELRRRIAEVRYEGQDSSLAVEIPRTGSLAHRFEQRYRELYGHVPAGRRAELVALRVVASARDEGPGVERAPSPPAREAGPPRFVRNRFRGGAPETPVFERNGLPPGASLRGPALVLEEHGATVVEAGWELSVDPDGALRLQRLSSDHSPAPTSHPEAVRLELFTNRLSSIAREMGAALQRTAVSTNIKERLDFSCAILDDEGRLVVNAPHVPVHLGSLGLCVRAVRERLALRPGDVALTNHPAFGGSHLPDVTLIEALHDARGETVAYVAARAHHAEIGGRRPGSMPPDARCLADEGVVLAPRVVGTRAGFRWTELREELVSGPWPSRAPDDNIADFMAAAAATHRGVRAMAELLEREGSEGFRRRMRAINERGARWTEHALRGLEGLDVALTEDLDDGTRLALGVRVAGGRARFDFTGTDPRHPTNLNATPAIVRSAVLYVLRLLVDEPIPLNEGMLDAAEIILPTCLLNPEFPEDPRDAPALVGGNVEISQRLVNGLVRALGIGASSQGTMNNLLFGNERFSYYETICGGVGAGPGFDGASAVHSHMTNTRITDPEILEHRFPVRVERFQVRRGSGGAGRWRGGDGVIRELRFLAPLSLALLAQHHARGPEGLAGGGSGAPGSARLFRADGREEALTGSAACEAQPGDRLVLETPGGGGFGPSEVSPEQRADRSKLSSD